MKTVRVWCPCGTVYTKNPDGCPACGAPPRNYYGGAAERRQRRAMRGAAAAANLNAQALHAVKHT